MSKQSDEVTRDLPEGTVTFLFTDIEGSTNLLRQLGDEYAEVLVDQRRILRTIFDNWHGREVDTQGDSFFVSFPRATEAVAAAVDIQRSLAENKWPQDVQVRVRMGLHTGEPLTAEEGYVGMDVHRAARIAHVGHGGQVLLSATTTELVVDELPNGASLLDLGHHRLKDIARPEHIRQLVIRGQQSDYPPLKSLESIEDEKPVSPNNLPVQSTPFIGREDELADLEKLLGDPGIRMITVVGPGGMGKTRLALALAERQLEISLELSENGGARYPDGAFFIPLDGLDETEQIVPEIASSLNIRVTKLEVSGGQMDIPERSPKQQLLDYLSNKRLLLVMDNFEHLLAGAGLLSEIRQQAPTVKVVATSREKLDLHGEQLYQLQGMSVPKIGSVIATADELLEEFSSAQLFLQSARRALPSFELQPRETKELALICRLLGGMPLAVELSAGWIDMLSMSDITAEIEQGLDLLETSTLDIPERQRSILAIFEGTWRRLSPAEQSVFEKLCIFRGGFTRKAAEEVAGASLRQLAALMSKSLLLYDRQTNRYDIHRLLRQYGLERLADDPENEQATRDGHSAYFLETIAVLEVALYSAQYQSVTNKIEGDLENIRAALHWAAVNQRVEFLGNAIPPLFQFYAWRSYDDFLFKDAEMIVEGLVGLDSPHASLIKARVLARQGWFLADSEDMEFLEKSQAILKRTDLASLDTRRERAFALLRIGSIIIESHDLLNVKKMLEESQVLFREVGDRWGEAATMREMATYALASGNSLEHEHYIEKCSAIRAELGNPLGLVYSLNDRALLAIFRGNTEEAIVLSRQAKEILLKLGDPRLIALSAKRMGFYSLFSGHFYEALESYEEAILIYEKLGSLSSKLGCMVFRAYVNLHIGDFKSGYLQAGQLLDDYSQLDLGYIECIGHYILGCSAVVDKEYEYALARSQQAVDCFRGLATRPWWLTACLSLYTTAGVLGEDIFKARRYILEAVQIAVRMKEFMFLVITLPAAALLLAYIGEQERAIELQEMGNRHPFVANSRWYKVVMGKRLIEMEKGLTPDAIEIARKRGRERDPWETAKELLAELESVGTQD